MLHPFISFREGHIGTRTQRPGVMAQHHPLLPVTKVAGAVGMPSGAIVTLVDYCALSPESSRTLPVLIRRPNIANPILDRLDRPARGGRADGLVLVSRPLHEGESLCREVVILHTSPSSQLRRELRVLTAATRRPRSWRWTLKKGTWRCTSRTTHRPRTARGMRVTSVVFTGRGVSSHIAPSPRRRCHHSLLTCSMSLLNQC